MDRFCDGCYNVSVNISDRDVIRIEQKFDAMKIDGQLSFLLYACSREVIKQYKPFLDAMDLTYTQYIVMMVLWERDEITVKELGDTLYLDSGTLTPLLKKLENKGYILRKRSRKDERNLLLSVTEEGNGLKSYAKKIAEQIECNTRLSDEDTGALFVLLRKVLGRMDGGKEA